LTVNADILGDGGRGLCKRPWRVDMKGARKGSLMTGLNNISLMCTSLPLFLLLVVGCVIDGLPLLRIGIRNVKSSVLTGRGVLVRLFQRCIRTFGSP
jgi:hypothetical protein